MDKNEQNNYKQRFINEYAELKDKYTKLHKMLVKYDVGKLEFTPTCPIDLLRKQESLMGQHLNVLEVRAVIEDVELPE
jgi:conserved domain protein